MRTFHVAVERTHGPGHIATMIKVFGARKSFPDLAQVFSSGGLPNPSLPSFSCASLLLVQQPFEVFVLDAD